MTTESTSSVTPIARPSGTAEAAAVLPDFTIVIPCYNERDAIKRTIGRLGAGSTWVAPYADEASRHGDIHRW